MGAVMTSRQAAELDHALERNGWTAEDVKKASGGELLASLLLVVRGRAEVVAKSILTLLRTVRIAAQPAVTTSEEYFEEAGVVWTGENFKAQFLGLEVPAAEETDLAVHWLEEASLDAPIRAELGNKAEILVSQFRAFLADEHGISGWFVCYLRGKDRNLWAVRAHWDSDRRGRGLSASSVEGPREWFARRQVLSQV